MRKVFFGLIIVFSIHITAQEKSNIDFVNTLIGTKPWSGKIQLAGPELAEGHTYPGVGPPFAMTEWTPQTTTGAIPYWYEEGEKAKIQGFRASHYPSGAVMAEYGSLTVFPATGKPEVDPEKRASWFDHATEIAKPYFYSVFLHDYQIEAKLTATSRVGFLKFKFPESDSSFILIDFFKDGGIIQIDSENKEIYGYSLAKGLGTPDNFACYFVAQFEKEFDGSKIIRYKDEDKTKAAWVGFKTKKDELIKVKTGTSFISIEQARNNLSNEIPGWDFDKTKKQTKAAWSKELKKIQVEGGSKADKTIFYTSLYHALLLPREFSEQGKYYSPFDGEIHEGVSFTDYSLWDTYRAEHPLLLFLVPDKVNLMISSLLNSYDEGGWIPKWPNPGYSNVMMGTHADALITDAFVKGVRDYDVNKAYEAMIKNANKPGTGLYAARVGIKDYDYYGFVPGDKYGESVARTLEFAYDDFCIAQMAKALNKENDYRKYIKRANYYKNVLDPQTKNVRGKSSNGAWMDVDDKSISVWAGYTNQSLEIYKWNHTFLAPHDVDGLIKFFGGNEGFINALDTLFHKEYYYVGDEFSMHAPYLYNYAGAAWKTQRLVREILNDYFTEKPDGLCGNDDCGQLSSWYVFGAIGFYPVAPGDDYYTIGSPLFEKITMKLPNRKTFIVTTENNSPENVYIQSATLNNMEFKKSFITHNQIMEGGNLHFVMGDRPNKKWGTGKDDVPVSSIESFDYLPVPYLKNGSPSFYDSSIVELGIPAENSKLYYTFDGNEPTEQDNIYNKPLIIKNNCILKARAFKKGLTPSAVIEIGFHKIPKGRSVSLLTNHSEKYPGGGANGLIDYKRGNYFFKSTCWQGYEAEDMGAVIDLGSKQPVNKIGVGFLQDISNWIFLPKEVEFYSSIDGINFELIETVKYCIDKKQQASLEVKNFEISTDLNTRYIKVFANATKFCPLWHDFKGEKSWLFVDEIIVE